MSDMNIPSAKTADSGAATQIDDKVNSILIDFNPKVWFWTFQGLQDNLRTVAKKFVDAADGVGTDEAGMVESLHTLAMICRFAVEDLCHYFQKTFALDNWDTAKLRYHLTEPLNQITRGYFASCVENDSRIRYSSDYVGYFDHSQQNPENLIRRMIRTELSDIGDTTPRALSEALFREGAKCIKNDKGNWVAKLPGLDVTDFQSVSDGVVPDFSEHPFLFGAVVVGGIALAVFCPPAVVGYAALGAGTVGVVGGLSRATSATVDSYSTDDDVLKKMNQMEVGSGLRSAALGAVGVYAGSGILAATARGEAVAAGADSALPAVVRGPTSAAVRQPEPLTIQPPKALPGPVQQPGSAAAPSLTPKPSGPVRPVDGAGHNYQYTTPAGETIQAELVPAGASASASESGSASGTATAVKPDAPSWWQSLFWPEDATLQDGSGALVVSATGSGATSAGYVTVPSVPVGYDPLAWAAQLQALGLVGTDECEDDENVDTVTFPKDGYRGNGTGEATAGAAVSAAAPYQNAEGHDDLASGYDLASRRDTYLSATDKTGQRGAVVSLADLEDYLRQKYLGMSVEMFLTRMGCDGRFASLGMGIETTRSGLIFRTRNQVDFTVIDQFIKNLQENPELARTWFQANVDMGIPLRRPEAYLEEFLIGAFDPIGMVQFVRDCYPKLFLNRDKISRLLKLPPAERVSQIVEVLDDAHLTAERSFYVLLAQQRPLRANEIFAVMQLLVPGAAAFTESELKTPENIEPDPRYSTPELRARVLVSQILLSRLKPDESSKDRMFQFCEQNYPIFGDEFGWASPPNDDAATISWQIYASGLLTTRDFYVRLARAFPDLRDSISKIMLSTLPEERPLTELEVRTPSTGPDPRFVRRGLVEVAFDENLGRTEVLTEILCALYKNGQNLHGLANNLDPTRRISSEMSNGAKRQIAEELADGLARYGMLNRPALVGIAENRTNLDADEADLLAALNIFIYRMNQADQTNVPEIRLEEIRALRQPAPQTPLPAKPKF